MRTVPLHCLVMIVGEKFANWHTVFPEYEYIKPTTIKQQITNNVEKFGLSETVINELRHRAKTKLHHGERVIVDARDMDKNARVDFVKSFVNSGVPIFYLVNDKNPELMQGDGLAEAIDVSYGLTPVLSNPEYEVSSLQNKFDGVTVLGDVHGMFGAMQNAISWAKARNHFIVFLGDIVDYGPSSLECVDEAYRLVMRGEAMFILGNHERKIMRWIDGKRVRLSDGNKITTSALDDMGNYAKSRWIGRFRGLYQNGSLVRKIGNVAFVHAAAHPAIWRGAAIDEYVENHAFFGEISDARQAPNKPLLSHKWVDSIPEDHVVVVGHEIRSTQAPLSVIGQKGGRAVFLDTGSGKGGMLSTADFKFSNNTMVLMNFNTF